MVAIARDAVGYGLMFGDGRILLADHLVLTAGTRTPALARQLGIDLPVEPVKQTVFTFDSPFQAPDMPFLFTPDGLFCRPEGRDFGAGVGVRNDDPAVALDDMEPDTGIFDAEVWPRPAHRVGGFEQVRFRGAGRGTMITAGSTTIRSSVWSRGCPTSTSPGGSAGMA